MRSCFLGCSVCQAASIVALLGQLACTGDAESPPDGHGPGDASADGAGGARGDADLGHIGKGSAGAFTGGAGEIAVPRTDAGTERGGATDNAGGASGQSGRDIQVDAAWGDAESDGGAPGAELYCDDGNDCTLDSHEGGRCAHTYEPDRRSCDDGNACTTDDHCEAGRCVGSRLPLEPNIVGRLDSFGGFDESDPTSGSLSAVLADDLAVVADRSRGKISLKLVEITADGMQVLDTITNEGHIAWNVSGWWGRGQLAHLVPLSPSRLALISPERGIDVYDVVNRRWAHRVFYSLNEKFWTAAGRGGNLWLGATRLSGYRIADDGAVSFLAELSSLPSCDDIVLSDDSRALYAACRDGTFAIDVSNPSAPALESKEILPDSDQSTRPYRIAAHGPYVFVQEQGELSTAGPGHLVRVEDRHEFATFAPNGPFEGSIGGVFVGDDLLLQRVRSGTEQREFVAELYGIAGDGVVPKDQWTYRALPLSNSDVETERLNALGPLAFLPPSQRLVVIQGDKIVERKGLLQGALPWLARIDAHTIAAYGSQSSHRVDIGDPQMPVAVAGGLLSPGTFGQVVAHLSDRANEGPSLLNLDSHGDGAMRRSEWELTLFSSNNSSAPQPRATVRLPLGALARASSRGLAFDLRADEATNSYRVSAYALPRTASSAAILSPFDVISLPAGAASDLQDPMLAADPAGGTLVVAGHNAAADTLNLRWLSHDSGQWAPLGSVSVSGRGGSVLGLVAHRGMAFLLSRPSGSNSGLTVLDATTGRLMLGARRDFPWEVQRLLGVHDDRLYVTTYESDGPVALALDLADLATHAEYALPNPARSIASAGNHLVFGTDTTLLVATPGCGVTESRDAASADDGSAVTDAGAPDGNARFSDVNWADGGRDVATSGVPGDLSGNGCVDMADYDQFFKSYGKSLSNGADPRTDFNGDGAVDDADYVFLSNHWGEGC